MKPNLGNAYFVVMLVSLIITACGRAAPVVAPISPAGAQTEGPVEAANTSPSETPAPAQPAQPTATSQKQAPTPLPTSYPPHPLGCIQAGLSKSVLIQTWSEREHKHFITPIDSQTGQPLCNVEPLPAGISFSIAYAPDMRRLALVASDREDGQDSSLQLLELQRWQARPTQVQFRNSVVGMRFSPDGQRLAIAIRGLMTTPDGVRSYQIALVDAMRGRVAVETSVNFMPRLMRFSPDGGSLVVYGTPTGSADSAAGDAQVLLLDSANLETLWETSLEGVIHGLIAPGAEDDPLGSEIWEPAVVYTPEQHALYVLHADADWLTTVDFDGRTTHSVEIGPKASWFERLLALTAGVAHAKTLDGFFKSAVVSTDGRYLFAVTHTADSWQDADGNWQFTETPLGLQVIDLENGVEIARVDTPARQLFLSADGQELLLRGWDGSDWTEVLDVYSLEIERRLEGQSLLPGMRLDGIPLLLSVSYHSNGQTTLAAIDPATYQDIFKGWITYNSYWLVEP